MNIQKDDRIAPDSVIFLLSERRTAVEYGCAVEEEDVAARKVDQRAEHIASHIADIDDGDLAVSLAKERNDARAEGIAEDVKLAVGLGRRVFDREKGVCSAKEHLIRVSAASRLEIVERCRLCRARVVACDYAAFEHVICQITQGVGLERQSALTLVNPVKGRVERSDGVFARQSDAHSRGESPCRVDDIFLLPVAVGAVIVVDGKGVGYVDIGHIIGTSAKIGYHIFVIIGKIDAVAGQKIILVGNDRKIDLAPAVAQIGAVKIIKFLCGIVEHRGAQRIVEL